MIPVLSLLYFTNVEPMTWDTIPWALLCGVAGFTFGLYETSSKHVNSLVSMAENAKDAYMNVCFNKITS